MGKLVRDRIPHLIRSSGGRPVVRRLEGEDFVEALLAKVVEEAHELAASSPQHRLEEAADVLEVLIAVAGALGIAFDDVVRAAEQKRVQRGGFDERWWLEG